MAARKGSVVFRDRLGRFLSPTQRYSRDVAMVQVVRRKKYIKIAERPIPPTQLADLLSQPEFESLPEALKFRKLFTSRKKYKAWDIAEQIDRTRSTRRKNLKFTIIVQDGRQRRQVEFYHNIKRNQQSSYSIFRRINEEIGLAGWYLYNRTPGGKLLADRTGRQVHLIGIRMEEVI